VTRNRIRLVATGVALALSVAVVALLLGPATGSSPHLAGSATLRCTNPYSGSSWDVSIDATADGPKADSFPADITDRTIEWSDRRRGGRYRFDRASGELTVAYASSTGGFFGS